MGLGPTGVATLGSVVAVGLGSVVTAPHGGAVEVGMVPVGTVTAGGAVVVGVGTMPGSGDLYSTCQWCSTGRCRP